MLPKLQPLSLQAVVHRVVHQGCPHSKGNSAEPFRSSSGAVALAAYVDIRCGHTLVGTLIKREREERFKKKKKKILKFLLFFLLLLFIAINKRSKAIRYFHVYLIGLYFFVSYTKFFFDFES